MMDARPGSAVERATQAASKYINRKVSLLSTSDVRYNGELYTVDPTETSIALKHVDCLGTQDRRKGSEAISASDCTYEFIIFRAVNIKSLRLEEGDQRDLTSEILVPLRHASQELKAQQQRTSESKRRVGYDSHRGQEYTQGYDQRYAPPPSSGVTNQPPPAQDNYHYYPPPSTSRHSRNQQYSSGINNNNRNSGGGGSNYPQNHQYYDSRTNYHSGNNNQYGAPPVSSNYYSSRSQTTGGHGGPGPLPQSQGGGHGGVPYTNQHSHSHSRGYGSSQQYPNQGRDNRSSRDYYSQNVNYGPPPPSSGVPPPQSNSRGPVGVGGGVPPPNNSAVRQGRSYYQQTLGYPRDYQRPQQQYYDPYGRQIRNNNYYQPNRDYRMNTGYVQHDRRGYYQNRNYYNQPRQGYMNYQRQGQRMGGQRRMPPRRQMNMGGRPPDQRMQNRQNMGPQEAPGTGAFLQSKNLPEDPNDLSKLKDDFDFGQTKAFRKDNDNDNDEDEIKNGTIDNIDNNNNNNNDVVTTSNKEQESQQQDEKEDGSKSDDKDSGNTNENTATNDNNNNNNNDDSNEINNDDGMKEDKKDVDLTIEYLASMSLDIEPKYDKSKSFFDNLPQETRKDKKNEQTKEQALLDRSVDAETFGDIAKNYKSKHIGYRGEIPRIRENNFQGNGSNRSYSYNRNQNYNYNYNYNYNQNYQQHRYPRDMNRDNNQRRQRGALVPRGYDIRGFQTRQRVNRRNQRPNRRHYPEDANAQARWRKRD